MNPDFSPELQAELLDDFYTECDEHLGSMREQLIHLERVVAGHGEAPTEIESIYRSLHSLKGISAMVGLRPAEELAHAAEDFLRQLSRRESHLDERSLEVLVRVTQRLEQIVGAHRLRQVVPDTTEVLRQLSTLSGKKNPPPSSTPEYTRTAPPVLSGPPDAIQSRAVKTTWRCSFSPSKELDARGVNLSAIRARLSQSGEILSATPLIGASGSMTFEFIVAFREKLTDLTAWEADGLKVAPADAGAAQTRPAENPSPDQIAPSSSLFIAPSHIVRVDLSRLDELMRITGELIIHRSRLDERIHRIGDGEQVERSRLQEVNTAMARSLRDLRQAISRVRLVSVAEIFTRMPFIVRDLIQETEKRAKLVLEGQQTEIDKYLVERLKEPLLHLVRNAFAHGVESPAERIAAGKPEEATILLRATALGQSVVIQIRDDGRGVDPVAVANRAAASGIPVPPVLDSAALLELLCTPGFSTQERADRASGRGVGMAVVHTAVRQLGGSLVLETEKGCWTQFTLRLPLTLSIVEAFIVSAGEQTCAVPQSLTQAIVQIPTDQIRTINEVELVPFRGGLLPLVRLRSLFSLADPACDELTLLVLDSDRGLIGLAVDRVAAQRDVVVHPMEDPLVRVPGISGATELGNGQPVLIIDSSVATARTAKPRLLPRRDRDPVRSSLSS